MQNTLEITSTVTDYKERIERVRQEGYDAGYKAGASDMSMLLKFGPVDFTPKAINHMCDVCSAEYFGTDDAARENGWELGIGSEWCPEHAG